MDTKLLIMRPKHRDMSSPNTYLLSKILVATNKKKPGFGIISKNLQVGCQMLQVNRQTATVSLATIKLGMNAGQAALIPIWTKWVADLWSMN